MTYPWRAPIMPRGYRCKRAEKVCAYENCSLYYNRPSEYSRNFDTCEHGEMMKP